MEDGVENVIKQILRRAHIARTLLVHMNSRIICKLLPRQSQARITIRGVH